MKIYFNKSSLEISSHSKTITGVISITPDGNTFFPEENWNDSIIIILDSWITNMMSVLTAGNNEAVFVFFDGPFSFRITKRNAEYIMELLQGSRPAATYRIDLEVFGFNLVTLSQEILQEVKARGWNNNDLKQLELSLKKASSYFYSKN